MMLIRKNRVHHSGSSNLATEYIIFNEPFHLNFYSRSMRLPFMNKSIIEAESSNIEDDHPTKTERFDVRSMKQSLNKSLLLPPTHNLDETYRKPKDAEKLVITESVKRMFAKKQALFVNEGIILHLQLC